MFIVNNKSAFIAKWYEYFDSYIRSLIVLNLAWFLKIQKYKIFLRPCHIGRHLWNLKAIQEWQIDTCHFFHNSKRIFLKCISFFAFLIVNRSICLIFILTYKYLQSHNQCRFYFRCINFWNFAFVYFCNGLSLH